MYFVTMLTHLPKDSTLEMPRTFHKRTVGYFKSFNDAERCLTRNISDVHEMNYPYAVIEDVEEGFYPNPSPVGFYEYLEETNEYSYLTDVDFERTYFVF